MDRSPRLHSKQHTTFTRCPSDINVTHMYVCVPTWLPYCGLDLRPMLREELLKLVNRAGKSKSRTVLAGAYLLAALTFCNFSAGAFAPTAWPGTTLARAAALASFTGAAVV